MKIILELFHANSKLQGLVVQVGRYTIHEVC